MDTLPFHLKNAFKNVEKKQAQNNIQNSEIWISSVNTKTQINMS